MPKRSSSRLSLFNNKKRRIIVTLKIKSEILEWHIAEPGGTEVVIPDDVMGI